MSISSENSKNSYTGNSTTKEYDYTFKIFNSDHLIVKTRDSDGLEYDLDKTTDYTVDGVNNKNGGSITLVNQVEGLTDDNDDPYESPTQPWLDVDGYLETGYVLVIERDVDYVQNTDIRNQGPFSPEIHENAFDYLTMLAQQLKNKVKRAIKYPSTFSDSDFDPELPGDLIGSANKSIVTNDSGDGFEVGPTVDEISNAESYANQASDSKDLANEWATRTDDHVTDTSENSAKAYAIGGTDDGQPDGGSAKDWAIKTDAEVITDEYSAKEHAIGTQNRGQAGGGSAKDWATYTGGTVDDSLYSAKHYAEQAQSAESYTTSSSDTVNNNQSTWENISQLTLDATLFSSAKYFIEIYRYTDSEHSFANGEIFLQRKNGAWRLETGGFFGDPDSAPGGGGVTFNVTESGGVAQVQYKSSNISGSNYDGTIKFRRLAFNV